MNIWENMGKWCPWEFGVFYFLANNMIGGKLHHVQLLQNLSAFLSNEKPQESSRAFQSLAGSKSTQKDVCCARYRTSNKWD